MNDFIIMKAEIDKPHFLNKRMDKSRLLAPNDPKDLKKIRNRVVGLISIASAEVLKTHNFLKYKGKLKTTLEAKLKEIGETDYESKIDNKDKMSPFCISLLNSKYKRLKTIDLLKSYSQDMLQTAGKLNVCT